MFKEGTARRKEENLNISIFSAYTDACSSSCKIVVASKRPLISVKEVRRFLYFAFYFRAKDLPLVVCLVVTGRLV